MANLLNEPDISVIVPVYNVENYLRACLDSLVNQTIESIEIIAVNDGSTDSSPKILAEYENKYQNIRVIHQRNAGLSAARNSGVEQSKGRYIGFLDSDDFADHNAYKTLFKVATDQKADIVKSGLLSFQYKTGSIVDIPRKPEMNIRKDTPVTTLMKFLQKKMNIVVWSGIYRADIFRDLKFPVGRKYEDYYYTPNALLRCERFIQTSDILFYYRRRDGAITSGGDVMGKVDKVQSLNEIYRLIHETDTPESFAPLFSKFFLNTATDYHNSLVYSDPLELRAGKYALGSIIEPELFTFILTYGELSDRRKNDLLRMRRSHYLYFLAQKTRRLTEGVTGAGSDSGKTEENTHPPLSEESQRTIKHYLNLYA